MTLSLPDISWHSLHAFQQRAHQNTPGCYNQCLPSTLYSELAKGQNHVCPVPHIPPLLPQVPGTQYALNEDWLSKWTNAAFLVNSSVLYTGISLNSLWIMIICRWKKWLQLRVDWIKGEEAIKSDLSIAGRVERKGTPLALLVEMQIDMATVEYSLETPLKTRNNTTIWPRNPTTGHTLSGNHNWKRHMHPSVHWSTSSLQLFTIVRTWKQPRCSLTENG